MAQKSKQLYYENAYLSETEATVIDVKSDDKGSWWLTDQSIFYPGGGGQPADSGWLDTQPVTEVRLDDQGIWHLVPSLKTNIGPTVKMKLDWDRRYYMMKQHSGQHLLSHVLHQANVQTVSVHLGEEHTLIEVDGPIPNPETLKEIEQSANSLIQQHLDITVHWPDKDSIEQFNLRRAAKDWDTLRVLEIEDRDFSACGGTHVNNTAEIGLIKMLATEKIRGNTRIKFFIAQKAYAYFDRLHNSAKKLKELLQVDPDKQDIRVSGLMQEISDLHRQNDNLLKMVVHAEARQLSQQSKVPVIFHRILDGSPEQALLLAKTLAGEYLHPAFIISKNRFYFILPPDHPAQANEFLSKFGTELSLRGGGPADFVQGIVQAKNDLLLQEKLHKFIK